jgi:hypothetical protein
MITRTFAATAPLALAAALALTVTPAAGSTLVAAGDTTWTFVSSGGGSPVQSWGSSYGNVRKFTQSGQVVWTSAWSDTGTGSLETAFLGRHSSGLGVCNRLEGTVSACVADGVDHQVDNVSQQDYVLFRFEGPVALQSLVVDPTGSWDRDVSFWVGTVDPLVNLTGVPLANLAGLGFGGRIDVFNSPGESALPVSLGGLIGNAILVSALSPPDGSADRFKIRSLTAGPATVVPVPAAAWLFVSAGGLLAACRRAGARPA